ncbi:MAG: zinc-binding dehydrogenase, partial [Alphaproteobacteria bacterium]
GCGVCTWCIDGHQHICSDPWVPGFSPQWPGGFGPLVPVAHADLNAIALPEAVSSVAAAGMGCRYMTAWHGLVDRGRIRPGEWLAVYGCGGVGLSAVQIASALGAQAIAVDLDPAKLEMAAALGAVATVNARANDPVDAVRALTGGGAHVAVDALGLAETCRNALMSLRKRGRHIQIGIATESDRDGILLPTDTILGRELEVIGSYGMPLGGYAPLFAMIESGRLAPERLVTRQVGVEETGPVLESMGRYDTRGIVVITSF